MHAPPPFLRKYHSRPLNWLKNNYGWANKAGITSVDLAIAGYEGNRTISGHPKGPSFARKEVVEKFFGLSTPVVGRSKAEQLCDGVLDLENRTVRDVIGVVDESEADRSRHTPRG